MKEKIENPELQRYIKKELKKSTFEEVSDEEIECLQGIEFVQSFMDGKPTGVQISDIRFFPNLIRLNLVGYQLTESDMEMLTNLSTLECIQFDSCSFSDIDFDSIQRLPQIMQFFRCVNLPQNYWKNGFVNLKFMDADFKDIPFEKVKEIRLENCIIRNAHDIEEYSNIEKVILDSSTLLDSEGNELKNINVPKKAYYSHTELKKYPVMGNEMKEEIVR